MGVERARYGAYPWRSLLDAGAVVTNGTDAPVEDVKRAKALAYLDAHEYVQEIGIDAFTEKVRKGLSAASAPN